MVPFPIASVALPFDRCTPICAMPTEYQNEESSGSGAPSKEGKNREDYNMASISYLAHRGPHG